MSAPRLPYMSAPRVPYKVVQEDSIPADVRPYLVPSERQVITVHRHPVALFPPAFLLAADVTVFVLTATDVIPGGGAVLAILALLLPLCGYILYRSVFRWLRFYFVLTNSRMLLVNGHRKRSLTAIPITEAGYLSFTRTLPGAVVGYGAFRFNTGYLPKGERKVNLLPFPEQLYLEISGLILSSE